MDSSLLETYVFDENNYKSLINTSLTYHIIPFFKKKYNYSKDMAKDRYIDWYVDSYFKYYKDNLTNIHDHFRNEYNKTIEDKLENFTYVRNLVEQKAQKYFDTYNLKDEIDESFLKFIDYIIYKKMYNDFIKSYNNNTLTDYLIKQINKRLLISKDYNDIYYYNNKSRMYQHGRKQDIETIIYKISNNIINKELQYYNENLKIYNKIVDKSYNTKLDISYEWLKDLKNKEIIIKDYYDMNIEEFKFMNLNNVNKYELPINDSSNKVINLKTLEIKNITKDSYFTNTINKTLKIPDFSITYETPEFIKDITNNNIEKINLLQDLFYYLLSGDKSNQSYFIFYGLGSNGKTTLLKALENIFNNEMIIKIKATEFNKVDTEDLIKKYSLNQKRIVFMDEFKQNCFLNEVNLNKITDDSNAKLIISTNIIPKINIDCYGVERRIIYFPIETQFVDTPKEKNERKRISNYEINIQELFNWILQSSLRKNEFNIFTNNLNIILSNRKLIINYNMEKHNETLFVMNYLKKVKEDTIGSIIYNDWIK